MNLGEFKSIVRDSIARGTSVDGQIVTYVRQAARWIERNFTLKYMEQFSQVTLNKDAAFPHIIDAPSLRVKSYQFVRIVLATGDYIYLNKINARDCTALDTNQPKGFWLDNVQRIVLDCKPAENYVVEFMYNEYSAWPISDASMHWLFDNAEDVLLAQTLLGYAPFARDNRTREALKAARDEALTTLSNSIIDQEFDGASMSMGYYDGSQR